VELHLCPRRRRSALLRPVGALAAFLGCWLALVVLLPPTLGLRTAVVAEPDGPHAEGTLVVLRTVPVSDLVEGDVVAAGGDLRRVASVDHGMLEVDGVAPQPSNEVTALPRVVSAVPVAGLPLSGPDAVLGWLALGVSAVALGAVAPLRRAPGRVRASARA
jgi:hypothetical protein